MRDRPSDRAIAQAFFEVLIPGDSRYDAITGFTRRVIHRARAIDAAATAQGDGWVVVPREATDEMIEAAWDSDAADYVGEHKRIHSASVAWRAMLAAAPQPPPAAPAEPVPSADARDAERWRKVRNAPIDEPWRVPRIAVPTSRTAGEYVNGEDADAAVDAVGEQRAIALALEGGK